MESQIAQNANHLGEREKGEFLSLPVSNPKGQFVIGNSSAPTHGQEHVQAIVTLRSEKQMDNQVALPEETLMVERGEESHDKLAKDYEPNTAIPTINESPKKFVPKAHYSERLKALRKVHNL
jgi:hypothetical protein